MKLFAALFILLVTCTPLLAFELPTVPAETRLQQDTEAAITAGFTLADAMHEGTAVNETMNRYRMAIERLADRLQQTLDTDPGAAETWSTGLTSQPDERVQWLLPVADALQERFARSGDGEALLTFLRQNFPGYGQTQPGYDYRLGRELKRDKISTEWVEDTEIVVQNTTRTMYVENKLVKTMKYFYPPLLIMDAFSWLIYQKPLYATKVTFTATETLEFTTIQPMTTWRVWYELWRKPAGSGSWSKVGQSWQQLVEPAGEKVATKVRKVQ